MPRRRRTTFEAPSKGLQSGNGRATVQSVNAAHSRSHPHAHDGEQQIIRCAIYTRKSTSEGLDQAFNSLDAQREAAESYVASQKHAGWVVLPDRYDDGGYSGGSMDRPALAKLMEDIEARRIDCVVVYKVDRLSRSLLDFARIMKLFEDRGIHFVSVTQHFNTAESMGRLTLNILLSFAQFEREIISERTRDKIAASRRKGKWAGGWPILGYDIDRPNKRLVINEDEAPCVRAIFELYLQKESLLATVDELVQRGWTNKAWVTAKGRSMGGKRFDKTNLYVLLTNVAYLGKVRHKQDIYEGEHEAIVEPSIFNRVQRLLDRNRNTRGSLVRNKHGVLLKGLVRCQACDAAMVATVGCKGNKHYRYYICSRSMKRGAASCPTRSINASFLENEVIARLRSLRFDPARLANSTICEAAELFDDRWDRQLALERARLMRMVVQRIDLDRAVGSMMIRLTKEMSQCLLTKQSA